MSWPSQAILPADGRTWPDDARSVLVLPTPLRPITQVISPTTAVSDTPPERLAGAVVEVDALDLQHAQRPR